MPHRVNYCLLLLSQIECLTLSCQWYATSPNETKHALLLWIHCRSNLDNDHYEFNLLKQLSAQKRTTKRKHSSNFTATTMIETHIKCKTLSLLLHLFITTIVIINTTIHLPSKKTQLFFHIESIIIILIMITEYPTFHVTACWGREWRFKMSVEDIKGTKEWEDNGTLGGTATKVWDWLTYFVCDLVHEIWFCSGCCE